MRICFIVHSLSRQKSTYTTSHLAFEAYRRKHQVCYTTIQNLSVGVSGNVMAQIAVPKRGQKQRLAFLNSLRQRSQANWCCLNDFDVVFMRFTGVDYGDSGKSVQPALEIGRLLRASGVFVINDPTGIQKAASKMYLSAFPEHIRAPSIISRNPKEIKYFIKSLRRPAILKPVVGFGGTDVFLIKNTKEPNLNQILTSLTKTGYVIAQQYLPAAKQGDKRLLLLNGEPITVKGKTAIYRRKAARGEIRNNIHVGGIRKPAEYSRSDSKIVDCIRSKLLSDGLYFVGADIVGDKLLEINVFCPGGIQNVNALYGINVGAAVLEDLEKQVNISGVRVIKQRHKETNLSHLSP